MGSLYRSSLLHARYSRHVKSMLVLDLQRRDPRCFLLTCALQSAWLNESATLFRRRYYKNGSHAGFILYMTDAASSQEDVDNLRQALRDSKVPGNFCGGSRCWSRIVIATFATKLLHPRCYFAMSVVATIMKRRRRRAVGQGSRKFVCNQLCTACATRRTPSAVQTRLTVSKRGALPGRNAL